MYVKGNGKSLEENSRVAGYIREAMLRTVSEFVVIDPVGVERERHPDFVAAIYVQKTLGNGASVVTPDGRLLSFMADASTAATALRVALRALDVWTAAREAAAQ